MQPACHMTRSSLCSSLGVMLAWACGGVLPHLWHSCWEGAGQFGDSFGAINALFSGLALGGVIVAIWLQSRELELQREEMSKGVEAQQDSARLIALAALLQSDASQEASALAQRIAATEAVDRSVTESAYEGFRQRLAQASSFYETVREQRKRRETQVEQLLDKVGLSQGSSNVKRREAEVIEALQKKGTEVGRAAVTAMDASLSGENARASYEDLAQVMNELGTYYNTNKVFLSERVCSAFDEFWAALSRVADAVHQVANKKPIRDRVEVTGALKSTKEKLEREFRIALGVDVDDRPGEAGAPE